MSLPGALSDLKVESKLPILAHRPCRTRLSFLPSTALSLPPFPGALCTSEGRLGVNCIDAFCFLSTLGLCTHRQSSLPRTPSHHHNDQMNSTDFSDLSLNVTSSRKSSLLIPVSWLDKVTLLCIPRALLMFILINY